MKEERGPDLYDGVLGAIRERSKTAITDKQRALQALQHMLLSLERMRKCLEDGCFIYNEISMFVVQDWKGRVSMNLIMAIRMWRICL